MSFNYWNTEHPIMWLCFWSQSMYSDFRSAYAKCSEHVNYTSDLTVIE